MRLFVLENSKVGLKFTVVTVGVHLFSDTHFESNFRSLLFLLDMFLLRGRLISSQNHKNVEDIQVDGGTDTIAFCRDKSSR